MGAILVAVSAAGLTERMAETVARLAGTGERQDGAVTVVHVAKVWGSSLGIQHPALRPTRGERTAAREVAARAALALRERGVEAEALVVSGRDAGKALADVARRMGAEMVIVGRTDSTLLGRLLRGADPARVLLNRLGCTLVIVDD